MQMHSLTCITCRVFFQVADAQRYHYKSDWHRYNLKRKVADAPPVTEEEFRQRIALQTEEIAQAEQHSFYCKACRKTFTNEKSFINHLESKKHSIREQNIVPESHVTEHEDSEIEEVDSDEWEDDAQNPIENNNCLFCTHHSRTIPKILKHMSTAHSFFIPDIEYCIDIRGLLLYLGEKIVVGLMCLWCDEKGKSFYSVDAVRQHMIDKGHCKMLHEGIALLECSEFYDYSSSHPDANEFNVNDEMELPELDGADFELVLPSGIKVGHRSLLVYYKQSISNQVSIKTPKSTKLKKVLLQYRSLGWTKTEPESVQRKTRDVTYMKRAEAKWNLNISLKNNKFQKYFRPQVNY